jgi:hypothetical protein
VFNLIAKEDTGMARSKVKVGAIKDVSGEVNIAGSDIFRNDASKASGKSLPA